MDSYPLLNEYKNHGAFIIFSHLRPTLLLWRRLRGPRGLLVSPGVHGRPLQRRRGRVRPRKGIPRLPRRLLMRQQAWMVSLVIGLFIAGF